jgi:hypothetical protein
MTDTQSRIARAGQVVEDYAEGWQRDHREVLACYEFEAHIAHGVAAFRFVEVVRVGVEFLLLFEGMSPSLWSQIRSQYANWLKAAQTDLADLEQFEAKFGSVAHSTEFRDCVKKAEAALANWPAVPTPKAVGSRMIALSEEEAAELRALQNAPPDAAGKLKIKPRSIPLADDSLLT